jgi:hypothetical protein
MVNSSQISERTAAYLNGHMDIVAFEDWIIANTWNIHLTGDSEMMDLAYEIEEFLNEYSLRNIDETRLKEKLKYVLYSMKPKNVIVVNLTKTHPSIGWEMTTTQSVLVAPEASV